MLSEAGGIAVGPGSHCCPSGALRPHMLGLLPLAHTAGGLGIVGVRATQRRGRGEWCPLYSLFLPHPLQRLCQELLQPYNFPSGLSPLVMDPCCYHLLGEKMWHSECETFMGAELPTPLALDVPVDG